MTGYPVDWFFALLSPTQWVAVVIVLGLVCGIALSFIVAGWDEGGEAGQAFFAGLLLPLAVLLTLGGILHFVSFIVWLWIGAPWPA